MDKRFEPRFEHCIEDNKTLDELIEINGEQYNGKQ